MRPLAMYGQEFQPPERQYRAVGQPLIVMNFLTWPAVTPCLADSPPKCAAQLSDFGCTGYARRRLTPQRI